VTGKTKAPGLTSADNDYLPDTQAKTLGIAMSTVSRCLVLVASILFSLHAQANTLSDVDHEEVTLWSHGVRLAGDIFKPKNLQATDKLPGILMVPGWGGSKNNVAKNYAPHFAAQGFVVLTFDFRTWGESDGYLLATDPLPESEEALKSNVNATHIRKIINPFAMAEDVRAALHYLGGEPQVIVNQLGIWGTSMGGGLALLNAASDDRVQALVSQMGPVNYPYNLKALPAHFMRHAETQAARGLRPPFPGPQAKNNAMLKGYPDWPAMKRFDLLPYFDRLQAATLIIDAENETLFETEKNGKLLHQHIKDRLPSRYLTYPGGHYDMYKGENLVAARNEALQWFVTHLKK
jgi:dienelactone hydrolase